MTAFCRERRVMAKGRIEIDRDKCKGCEFCITACKFGVIALSPQEKTNGQGYRYLETVKPDNCTGCTLCAVMCPDAVITVWRAENKGQS